MNLAIGSALACIGLTVPVVVVAAITLKLPLVLGLAPMEMALLAVTFLVSAFTLGTGRTYVMQAQCISCCLLCICSLNSRPEFAPRRYL
jgi:Ca2+/H+ antiporter